MPQFKAIDKNELAELLAKGHRRFGPVLARRPYREEVDDEGGLGVADMLFESHPLLQDQPIGADDNLANNAQYNTEAEFEAEKRHDEASPELKKQLDLKFAQQHALTNNMKPSPL